MLQTGQYNGLDVGPHIKMSPGADQYDTVLFLKLDFILECKGVFPSLSHMRISVF